METFSLFMSLIIDFMKTPFSLWGFEMSYWSIFLFVIIGSMIFSFIGSFLNPYRG